MKGKPTPFTFIKFFMPNEIFLYLGGGDSRTYSIAQIHKSSTFPELPAASYKLSNT
jgi:hypothetical protein